MSKEFVEAVKKRVAQAERMILDTFGPVGTVGFAVFCEAVSPRKQLRIATTEAIDEEVRQVRLDEDGYLLARVMNGGRRRA